MNLENLKPWNWFKHEENGGDAASRVPVQRNRAKALPTAASGSLLDLHREMDRWFEDAFKSFGAPALTRRGLMDNEMAGFFRPQIDVSGDDNCYEIKLDVPGIKQEDLSLELKDDVLMIKGQKEERKEDKDKQYYRVERSYGSFQRTLALPDDANADEIRADLDQGVLKLVIPRRSDVKKDARRIAISS